MKYRFSLLMLVLAAGLGSLSAYLGYRVYQNRQTQVQLQLERTQLQQERTQLKQLNLGLHQTNQQLTQANEHLRQDLAFICGYSVAPQRLIDYSFEQQWQTVCRDHPPAAQSP